jgi:hypothetical protein
MNKLFLGLKTQNRKQSSAQDSITNRQTPLPPQLLEAIRQGSLDVLRSAMEELCYHVPKARAFIFNFFI